jgi:hypothetical protein
MRNQRGDVLWLAVLVIGIFAIILVYFIGALNRQTKTVRANVISDAQAFYANELAANRMMMAVRLMKIAPASNTSAPSSTPPASGFTAYPGGGQPNPVNLTGQTGTCSGWPATCTAYLLPTFALLSPASGTNDPTGMIWQVTPDITVSNPWTDWTGFIRISMSLLSGDAAVRQANITRRRSDMIIMRMEQAYTFAPSPLVPIAGGGN